MWQNSQWFIILFTFTNITSEYFNLKLKIQKIILPIFMATLQRFHILLRPFS